MSPAFARLRGGNKCGRALGRVYDARVLTPQILGRTLAEAPDPELARVAISRVGDDAVARKQLTRPEVLPVAVRLLGFSTAAADFLVRHPEEVATLADVRPRTRAELEARQSWTVNAARLAASAPWVVLAFLSMRPESVRAYATGVGGLVLLSGAALTVVAYRLMVRIGRLPAEERVLR